MHRNILAQTFTKPVLTTVVLSFSSFAFSQDIGSPVTTKPDLWQPAKLVVFGDSLSDSNGDSFRPPETAHSTYNLLRTLRGETAALPDGTITRPTNLDQIIGRRATIDNIKANFDLVAKEIRKEGQEKGFTGRVMNNVRASVVKSLGTALNLTLKYLDKAEDHFDENVLKRVERITEWVQKRQKGLDPSSLSYKAFDSLNRQFHYLTNLIEKDMTGVVLDFGNDQLINITSRFADAIPLVPAPEYYVTGKWTTGEEMDQVWVEYLYKMMSNKDHQVKLDNRAMAGSWTLCAADKVEAMGVLDDLTDGLVSNTTMLFQGSLIPPCESLVIQSYLNERRNIFEKDNGHTPNPGDSIIEPDTLVVFFNSANDFLNKWSDPDDVAQEHARNVWHILSAGAQRVAVVLLPDISDTPRYHPNRSEPKNKEALFISDLVQRYNTSLLMRLNLLREEFHGSNSYQVMTIDGNKMFKELQAEKKWDITNPILDIAVPGTDLATTQTAKKEPENFVIQELKQNRAFDDTWNILGARIYDSDETMPFFADSVHPSAEAHYAIAEKACQMMSTDFNIPCSINNYPPEQAKADKGVKPAG
ncbi:SGNH/GDSL hydrolase family protein [Parendozoicomonas sp. Alg238-R29]|uniref:SGNH/GDSL hydrolase family protein n=1 Tax=Parendozoicomonas sp. Alg238-R29 TaxID=2993446 RepID=UPI00248F3972|nr:SGNH/GDSL hydrolase family protein [Parendozoicomonas sp. Alg238-R29]